MLHIHTRADKVATNPRRAHLRMISVSAYNWNIKLEKGNSSILNKTLEMFSVRLRLADKEIKIEVDITSLTNPFPQLVLLLRQVKYVGSYDQICVWRKSETRGGC